MKIPPNSCVLTWNCSRAQIMDDAINLAKSGQLDYKTALGLTGYLSKEEEYVPWFSALKGLSYIDNMLKKGKNSHGLFKKLVFSFSKFKIKEPHISRYMLRLLGPIYRELGFDAPHPEDTHLRILLRKKVVGDDLIKWIFNLRSIFPR